MIYFVKQEWFNHLGDHRYLPLLFGAVVKGEQLMLITHHGEDLRSVTLSMAIKGLHHVHTRQILHNDLKSNNVVVEKRNDMWNPVIIDFGKARFISDPKPRVSLMASSQQSFKRRYPHIAPEIVAGSGHRAVRTIGRFFFRENCAKHSRLVADSNCDVPQNC